MQHSQGTLTGARDLSVFYQYWQPTAPARAVLIIAHGAAEHGGRYEHVAKHFTDRSYAVVALDHTGHGQSQGTPGFIERFDDYVATLHRFSQQVSDDFPDLPRILVGHSMGGLIAADYLLHHAETITACILSGPAIKTELEPGWFQTLVIRILSRLAPRSGVLQLDANGVSRDPDVVSRYRADPLVYTGKLSARSVEEMFKTMQRVQARAAEISAPLLLLHGEADALTTPTGSQFLHDAVSSATKRLKIYPGLYHEIFNEPEQQEVFKDMEQWCNEVLQA